jgi:tetratricopeptide (TPR) repeat protein
MGCPVPRDYTASEVAELLGLPLAEVRRCVRAGILESKDGESFSFQDLVTLRKAAQLASTLRPSQVRKVLAQLRDQLPKTQPLSAVQLTPEGSGVVASDGAACWNPLSGQIHLDFAPPAPPAQSPSRPRLRVVPSPAVDAPAAEQSYETGCALEESAPGKAVEAYRAALQKNPAHLEARINLGRLLHELGRLDDAEAQYRRVLAQGPHALASFNLAVVLEDLGRVDDAIAAYQATLAADPTSEDAYFNLSRIYEQRGERAAALRALQSYKKLTQRR